MTFPLHRHIVLQRWRLSRNIALATGLVRSIFTRGVGGTILSIRRRVQPLADTALTGPATVHTRSGRLLLFIDAATPTPSRDSGSVRALALLRLCRELGWAVAFMPDNN